MIVKYSWIVILMWSLYGLWSTLPWISSLEFFELEMPFRAPLVGGFQTCVLFSQMQRIDYTCAFYTKEVHMQKDTRFCLFLTDTTKKET